MSTDHEKQMGNTIVTYIFIGLFLGCIGGCWGRGNYEAYYAVKNGAGRWVCSPTGEVTWEWLTTPSPLEKGKQ